MFQCRKDKGGYANIQFGDANTKFGCANTSVCPANTGFIAAGHQRATKLTSVFLSTSSFCICQLCASLITSTIQLQNLAGTSTSKS